MFFHYPEMNQLNSPEIGQVIDSLREEKPNICYRGIAFFDLVQNQRLKKHILNLENNQMIQKLGKFYRTAPDI